MLEALAGTGLAAAAGLNAYIPLIALGLLGRFTDLVVLPSGWAWLENEWVLGIIGVLLVIEFVADKVPALDSVNDIVQTVVRPASGGIVFGSGTAAQTAAISDPGAFFESGSWVPIVVGVVIALVVHLAKAALRVAANTALAGIGAPALSVSEDVASVGLVASAILLPALVIVVLVGLLVAAFFVVRWARRRAARRRSRVAITTVG
ncbi:DUF4126 domain-containing protein [Amnibacterium flavum]|uniref:DUF4126 domain-containing protein n=1 Tax=Amnibacterium flavum TaxID=2173173 RepID=A0A2V1HMZ7_9MICO|nr:DUF4126 domain-containing protein [Amnibacterium flavum]PVZ93845.1 DUF4126 domain-containing protein [Amnibacterium flavum]